MPSKIYVVARGRVPGFYKTWADCKKQVTGFDNARYKSFTDEKEAKEFYEQYSTTTTTTSATVLSKAKAKQKVKKNEVLLSSSKEFEYLLRFDGASKGNPGPASYGFVIYKINPKTREIIKTVVEGYDKLKKKDTNNVAEYCGVIYGLDAAKNKGIKRLLVQGDSMLVIKQLQGKYKATKMQEMYDVAKKIVDEGFEDIQFEHIYREYNTHADELANKAFESK
jgi:ribonuclease HI